MKDQIFTGEDVADALAAAGASLGVAPERLRYVVLDAGAAGPRDEPVPVRIAVMLDAVRQSGATAVRREPPRAARPGDVLARLRRVVRDLAEAAEVDLEAELVVDQERLQLQLHGPGRDLLLAEGGRALLALEHLLQRVLAREGDRRRLLIECAGFREARDAWLGERAAELAREVLEDGQPRQTEALNAYDRRIVHIAVSGIAGVRTFSVGDGLDRRVSIATATAE